MRPIVQLGSRTTTCRPSAKLQLQALEDRALPSFGLGWAFNTAAVYGFGIATDNSGSVYVSGSYSGTTNLDPNNTNPGSNHILTATGQYDGFVAKYLPDGTFQWATDVGPEAIGPYAQKVAAQGTAVYARFPEANADGTDNSAGVSRLDPTTGAVVWTTVLPSAGTEAGGVKIGPSGDAYTTWNSGGRLAVSRLGFSTGNVVWTATSNDNTNGGLAVDGSGNAYVLASLKGTATFGNTTLTSWTTSDADVAVWKLNANGASVWAGKMGSNGNDGWEGAAVDGSGNVYVVGNWGSGGSNQSQNNNFNPGSGGAARLTYHSGTGSDIFIVKLAPGKNGAMSVAWAKDIGASGTSDTANAIAVDGSGNIYTTGYFSGTVNFNPNSGIARYLSGGGIFVSKLDPNGNYVDATSFAGTADGTGNYSKGFAITVDGSGNVYTTGTFTGTAANFSPNGTYDLDSSTGDVFVSKLTQPMTPGAAPPSQPTTTTQPIDWLAAAATLKPKGNRYADLLDAL